MKKNIKCLDCETLIWEGSVRCKPCAHKGKLNSNFKTGNNCKDTIKVKKIRTKKTPKIKCCIDCNKQINKNSTRCKKCAKVGKLNSFYGKTHTEETNKINAEHNKGKWVGDKNPRFVNPLDGANNPNWRGGTSYNTIYPYKFKKKMRPLILATYTDCQWCGTKDDLVVHHIDHNIRNNDFCNLITLCRICNIKECHHQTMFKSYLFNMITHSKYLESHVGYNEFKNPYFGRTDESEFFIDSKYGKKSDCVANGGKEWGIIVPKP